MEAPLLHGEWKLQPNHVKRPDSTLLEYTPPEQVDPELERLIGFYRDSEGQDPIVRAAWFHHAFIRIHPFQDGNGRVARCLTLLMLLRADLAPLVVERRQRERYLESLDTANNDDLRPLVLFFAELEVVALRSELEAPALQVPEGAGALNVLAAGVDRLRAALREPLTPTEASQRASEAARLAAALQDQVASWLTEMTARFEAMLKDVDTQAHGKVIKALFDADDQHTDPRNWRFQAVEAAKAADFYTNLAEGSWWTRMRLVCRGIELRYLVFVQKVGARDTGMIALTVYAELLERRSDEVGIGGPILMSSPTETVAWVYNDPDDARWDDVKDILDTTLAAALHKYTEAMG